MLNTQMLRNLNSNLKRLEDIQNQMSTGKKINKPSDDPVGISFSLRYRAALKENEQFTRNVDSAISWIDNTESLISETNDVLQRARELAVQGANGVMSDEAMDSIAAEINQLYDHLVKLGNSKFNGKYIFNGQMTDIKPYDETNAENDTPNAGEIEMAVGVGVSVPVNIPGSKLFGDSTDTTNAFRVLKDLRDSLYSHDSVSVDQALGDIDSRIDKVLETWSEVGAKSSRVDLIKKRLENDNINLQTLLSSTEDANMAEVMINMKTEENIYQASLSTGARIIQPSLVDFLK